MNILRFATILFALIGSVALSIAPLAFPQSDEDSTPSVWESDSIPPPPAADYLKGPPALATDGFSGTAERFLGATHELEVPETNSDAIAERGQVLEIPQAVNAARVEGTFAR